MVHPAQMQQPMQQQHTHLIAQQVTMFSRLPSRCLQRNRQIAGKPSRMLSRDLRCRKAQHIRRFVLASELAIQPPQRSVVREQNIHFARQSHRRLRPLHKPHQPYAR